MIQRFESRSGRAIAATACLLAASFAAAAEGTVRVEVVPSPEQPAGENRPLLIFAQPATAEAEMAAAADDDAATHKVIKARNAAHAEETARIEVTPSSGEAVGGNRPFILLSQPTADGDKTAADEAPVQKSIELEAAASQDAGHAATPDAKYFHVFANSADARPAADALLQATDAHRKAFAEISNCRTCHADSNDKNSTVRYLNDVIWRHAVASRSGDAAPRDGGPKIGVTLGPVDDVLRAQLGIPAGRGLVVTEVLPETPAQRAGVEAHDLLVGVSGTNVESEAEFVSVLRQSKPGGPPLELRLVRSGQPLNVSVTPVFPQPPSSQPGGLVIWDAKTAPPTEQPRYRIGVSLAPADDTLRHQLSLGDTGVVILDVIPNTPAERQGLRAYDVLTRAGGRPVREERDMVEAVQASKDAKLELEIVRGGKRQYIAVAPEPAPEPTAAAGTPHGQPREMFVLPYTVQGDQIVGLWKDLAAGKAAPATEPSAAATAEQLDRIAAELKELRVALDALREQAVLDEAEQRSKAEKK